LTTSRNNKRGLWKLPRYGNSGKTNCVFPLFPTALGKLDNASSFPQFPQPLLLAHMNNNKAEQKNTTAPDELRRRWAIVYAIYLHSYTLCYQHLSSISQNPRLQRAL
jgi:hypothetical protein